jgi:hypothetical protein
MGATQKGVSEKMSQKVVLPKFDLPGQGPHPAVLAIRFAVGALVLALVVLAGALWRHHSLQVAAEEHAQALIAERAAQAAAAAEAVKARAAEAAAKIAQASAAAKAAAAQPKSAVAVAGTEAAGVADEPGHHHHHHHSSGKSKPVAKGDDRKPARPTSKRDDAAIDKLLASFK